MVSFYYKRQGPEKEGIYDILLIIFQKDHTVRIQYVVYFISYILPLYIYERLTY